MNKANDFLNSIKGIGKYISDRFYLTSLKDTPTGYLGHSGDYLVVNDGESGIHFTGIEKIASDLIDYGFGGNNSENITGFTGLHDTPSNYESGYYLRSTETGLEYIDSRELGQDIPVIPNNYNSSTDLPSPALDYDGEIVKVGCDTYMSCEGEWKPLVSTDRLPLSESERDLYPGCVTTVGDSISYDNYINATLSENSSLILEASLNGQTVDDVLHKVCTFQNIDGQSNDTSSEGTWQNITTNYNFASCAIQQDGNALRHNNTFYDIRHRAQNLRNPGSTCEFNRDGTLLLVGWAEDGGTSTFYVDVMSPNFDSQGAIQPSSAPIASLRSNIATEYWGRSASINDVGDVIAVSDIGVTNADGGHGAVVIYNLNLSTNTVTEKQIIRLPLTNNDYSSSSYYYDALRVRSMNVSLSGDGKTLVVQFIQNYFATNPKSLFIYNYNESTQMFELHQTINGIGFQNVKMSKDGSTIMVLCGYSIGPSTTSGNYDARGNMNINTKTAYFHGLKIFRRDSQNIWSNTENLSPLDLGIQEAVKVLENTSDTSVNWNWPITQSLGSHLDINREGTAITYQLPDTLWKVTADNYYTSRSTGPVGVITWDGQNWNRLGGLIFDRGNVGFKFTNIGQQDYSSEAGCYDYGSISDDGTFIMALGVGHEISYNTYAAYISFIKWNGSAWEKYTHQYYQRSANNVNTNGGFCFSKNPHPIGKTILAFQGRDNSAANAYYFTEECSTNLVSGGTISTNSPVSSCGVVRIKDTGYKWGLFPDDTEITIQAFPSPSCDFDGWGGQNIADPNALETTVNVTNDMSITGNFSVK